MRSLGLTRLIPHHILILSDAVRTHIVEVEALNVKAWILLAYVSGYQGEHIPQQPVLGHVLDTRLQYSTSNISSDKTYLPDHDKGN